MKLEIRGGEEFALVGTYEFWKYILYIDMLINEILNFEWSKVPIGSTMVFFIVDNFLGTKLCSKDLSNNLIDQKSNLDSTLFENAFKSFQV